MCCILSVTEVTLSQSHQTSTSWKYPILWNRKLLSKPSTALNRHQHGIYEQINLSFQAPKNEQKLQSTAKLSKHTKLWRGFHFIFILLRLINCCCGHIGVKLHKLESQRIQLRFKNNVAKRGLEGFFFYWGSFAFFLSAFLLSFPAFAPHLHILLWLGVLLSSLCRLASSVWYHKWQRSQRGFDRAQPAGCPEALPNERRGPAGVCWSVGHAGRRSLLQPGRGHCSGHGHPIPCHVHQHR